MSNQPHLNNIANLAKIEPGKTIDMVKRKPVHTSVDAGFIPPPVYPALLEPQVQFDSIPRVGPRPSLSPSPQLTVSPLAMDTNDDVIQRLKSQITSLKKEKKAAKHALDEMLSDLLAAQKEAKERALIVDNKDAEIAALLGGKRQMIVEHTSLQTQVAELSKAHEEKSTRLRMTEAAVLGYKENKEDLQDKITVLQQEVDFLISHQAGQKQVEDSSAMEVEKLKEEQHLRKLQDVETKMEHCARELQDERFRTAQFSQRVMDLEAAQLVASRVQPDAAAMQLKHDTEVEELRRRMQFFKNNSEQLSRQIKDLKVANKALQQTVQDANRRLDEQQSVINALN